MKKVNIDKSGLIVGMQIVSLPKSCVGAKLTYIVSLSYNGKIYDKQTRGDFCETHKVGEIVGMKWIDGIDEVMFPQESGMASLVSNILLCLLGLTTCVTIVKKRKNFN